MTSSSSAGPIQISEFPEPWIRGEMIHQIYSASWFSGQDLVQDSFTVSFDRVQFTYVSKSCHLAANYIGNYGMQKIFCLMQINLR